MMANNAFPKARCKNPTENSHPANHENAVNPPCLIFIFFIELLFILTLLSYIFTRLKSILKAVIQVTAFRKPLFNWLSDLDRDTPSDNIQSIILNLIFSFHPHHASVSNDISRRSSLRLHRVVP